MRRIVSACLATLAAAAVAGGQDRTCATWVDIGVPDEAPRSVDVKPSYPVDLFKASLAEIPEYQPGAKATGTIRVWGSDYVGSRLAAYWEEDFRRYQPDVRLEHKLVNALTAIPAITLGVGDVAPNRAATWAERFLFERVHNYPPLEIAMATGAWTSSFAIFVHGDNPISQLTMDRLDGIFGAQRTGAFVGTQWHPELARGPEANIRTWGQLGLTGPWKDKPIRLHGSILNAFLNRHFERLVFHGGVKWNEDFHEYETCLTADGKKYYRQDQVSDAVARDPYAIGFAYQEFGSRPGLKVLRIAARDSGPYVELTIQNLHDRTYPLSQNYYLYLDRKPGGPVDPKVKEFVRYILSREGQEAVARHGKYLPLTAEAVRAELRKLD